GVSARRRSRTTRGRPAPPRRPPRGGRPSSTEQQGQAGLLLWTGLHGLVSLYNDHGDLPWPPLDDLIADLLSLHTGRPAAEIVPLLAPAGG
ncbi:hypothetical protein AB0N16_37120, partial [Streptomyces sp. NPDC051105]